MYGYISLLYPLLKKSDGILDCGLSLSAPFAHPWLHLFEVLLRIAWDVMRFFAKTMESLPLIWSTLPYITFVMELPRLLSINLKISRFETLALMVWNDLFSFGICIDFGACVFELLMSHQQSYWDEVMVLSIIRHVRKSPRSNPQPLVNKANG